MKNSLFISRSVFSSSPRSKVGDSGGWWELSVRKKCWLTESNMTGRVRPKNTLSSLSQPIVIADWPGLGASRADWPRRRLLSFHSRAHWHTHTPFYNHCENKFFFGTERKKNRKIRVKNNRNWWSELFWWEIGARRRLLIEVSDSTMVGTCCFWDCKQEKWD